MNKKVILTAITAAAVVLYSCNKDNISPMGPSKSNPVSLKTVKVHQQKLNSELKELVSTIKMFKGTDAGSIREFSNDSIAPDSALALVEATLNYDFDKQPEENYDYYQDRFTVNVPFGENNHKVSGVDLNSAYQYLSGLINEQISATNNIVVIDIEEGVIEPGTNVMVMSANATFAKADPAYIAACGPYASNWSIPACLPSYWLAPSSVCPAMTHYFSGSGAVTKKLNCMEENLGIIPCQNGGSYFWINVNAYQKSNPNNYSNYQPMLYSSGYQQYGWFCNNMPTMSGVNIFNYKTAINADISSNLTLVYPNQIITKVVGEATNTMLFSSYMKTTYWELNVPYGEKKCVIENQ